jgi:Putative porin
MSTHLGLKSKAIAVALALILGSTGSTWAAPRADGSRADANTTTGASQPAATAATAATSSANAAAKPAEASSSSMESELQELRALLEAQAQQLQTQNQQLQEQNHQLQAQQARMTELEAALHPGSPEAAADGVVPVAGLLATTPIVATSAGTAPDPQDVGQRLDLLEAKLKAFGPFTFAGDFRLRDEPYFGGPVNDSQDRNRERYRARFYINARLNQDISGGLGLSTGDLNDPITSNQTANQFYTRKPFALDRAWINYNPHQAKALTLIGGKFAYPWYRTQLTWDDDIFPEGVAEKLEWKSDNWRVLRQFALIGFQLPFAETQNPEAIRTSTQPVGAVLPYTTGSIHQSVVYGGQLQTRWQWGSRVSFLADTAFYNYHNADPIALANQVAYGNPTTSSPVDGLLTLNNTLTNSFQTVTETVTTLSTSGSAPGNVVVSKQVIAAKLNSKFALLDSIAQFDIKTWSDRWPIRFLGDYVQNTEACGNDPAAAPFIPPATLTTLEKTSTITVATVNGTCDSHDRRANWLEARFGRQQEKGDWQFAYTHMLIEREAVMSLFDFSDIRQGSNVQQNRVEAYYQANKNVQVGFTGFFGRQLDTTNVTETELKRLQFDVIYKF